MVPFIAATALLMIALFNIFVYQRAEHEVTKVLCAAAAIVCIIWGFAIAHWAIHLFCLLLLVRYKFSLKPSPIVIEK